MNYALKGFLMETENHFYLESGELNFFCFIPFHKINDFVEIIGYEWFYEEPYKCYLKYDCLAVVLKEIFEEHGLFIKDFKECFNKDEYEEYEEHIKKFDF